MNKASLPLGGEPRVNLLPPEVGERAGARRTRKLLGLLVIGSLLLVGGGYGAASIRSIQALGELSAAHERSAELTAEQSTYSEVTAIAGSTSAIEDARRLGTSTEVLWNDVLDQIATYLPEGAVLASGSLKSRAPWEPELVPLGPLREPTVASLVLVVESGALLDATEMIRRLSALPGFADATPDSVTSTEGGFSTTITLNVDTEALSGRFGAVESKPAVSEIDDAGADG